MKNINTNTNTRILKNTVILFAALLLTKLIGATLKIPLTNIIGGLGMGYFSTANSLFSPIFALTAAALPTVIMRMVAQNAAAGRFRDVRRIRRAGLFAAAGLGAVGTLVMFAIATPFANYIATSPGSLLPILVIAPSLFFCSVSAVYKGYYEGLSNMLPTALSQIIEAVIKSAVGIALALFVLAGGGTAASAAAAAIAGITVSEFAGMVFLWARNRLGHDGISAEALRNAPAPVPKRELLKTLARESLPITVAALAMNLNPFIDMLTIPTLINANSGNGHFVFGSYTGIAIPIFAIATTLTALVCKSALPEITTAYSEHNSARLKTALCGLFKGTFVVGLPVCFGLAVLAEPILSLLYFSRPEEVAVSTPPLIALGFGGTSLLLAGALFGVFLSIGRADIQVKLMLAGAAIKLGGNFVLLRNPEIGVTGAAIATILCYAFVSFAGVIALHKCLKPLIPNSPLKSLKIHRLIAQSASFSFLCAATAYLCYYHLLAESDLVAWLAVPSSFLRLAMSVAAGGIVYLSATMFSERKYVCSVMKKSCEKY